MEVALDQTQLDDAAAAEPEATEEMDLVTLFAGTTPSSLLDAF